MIFRLMLNTISVKELNLKRRERQKMLILSAQRDTFIETFQAQ